MERFNLKKLNEVEGKEKYTVEVSNRFAASEDLNSEVDVTNGFSSSAQLHRVSYLAMAIATPIYISQIFTLAKERRETKTGII
jgi:hypothetical protein